MGLRVIRWLSALIAGCAAPCLLYNRQQAGSEFARQRDRQA